MPLHATVATAEPAPPDATTARSRPRVVLAMSPEHQPTLFDQDALDRLDELADRTPGFHLDSLDRPGAAEALGQAEVLVSCWGCPPLDERLLAAAPRLKAVIHAAGSVKGLVGEPAWERSLQVSSAAAANAVPVAEYTLAAVLLANKQILALRDDYRQARRHHSWRERYPGIGNYRRTVGVIGASHIGRLVLDLLRRHDLDLLLYDPYVDEQQAQELGARLVGLDELCAESDVVTIHAPEVPATHHMVDRRRLALMRDGATLVNTARASLVDNTALVEELASGRINGVLDVTEPEVLPADSPLYDLPNVLLTPHIAGSFGGEMKRMGAAALEELDRYTLGLPFAHPVTREAIRTTA